jgi:hypothetical protein
MKASVAILGGLAVWFLTRDLLTAVVHDGFHLTTLAKLAEAFGVHVVPTFIAGFMNVPAFLLAFALAAVFYLIVLWVDFT